MTPTYYWVQSTGTTDWLLARKSEGNNSQVYLTFLETNQDIPWDRDHVADAVLVHEPLP